MIRNPTWGDEGTRKRDALPKARTERAVCQNLDFAAHSTLKTCTPAVRRPLAEILFVGVLPAEQRVAHEVEREGQRRLHVAVVDALRDAFELLQ